MISRANNNLQCYYSALYQVTWVVTRMIFAKSVFVVVVLVEKYQVFEMQSLKVNERENHYGANEDVKLYENTLISSDDKRMELLCCDVCDSNLEVVGLFFCYASFEC